MKELLIHLRTLALFAQNAHNLAKGPLFLQDHCFLGEIYTAAQSDYDSVVERIIGTMGAKHIDLKEIMDGVSKQIASLPCGEVKQNSVYFDHIQKLEKKTCSIVERLCMGGISEGTRQLIGEIANQSEMRQYKIQQRLAK